MGPLRNIHALCKKKIFINKVRKFIHFYRTIQISISFSCGAWSSVSLAPQLSLCIHPSRDIGMCHASDPLFLLHLWNWSTLLIWSSVHVKMAHL